MIRLSVPSGGPVYGYNLLAWLLDRPAERYHPSYLKSERIDGRTTDAIQLIPAVPNLPFTKAVVWIDREDALPRRLEIHEESGATRTLSLSHLRVNQSVPAVDFRVQGSQRRPRGRSSNLDAKA